MDFKEFFKPTLKKVVITFVLLIFTSFFVYGLAMQKNLDHTTIAYGFPFIVKTVWQSMGPEGIVSGTDYIFENIIINTIFWYLISCIIFIKKSLKK